MSGKPFRIILFSDTHERAQFGGFRSIFDKRLLGFCNSRFRRGFLHDNAILERFIAALLADPPDLVVFTGDAVSTGDPREFERAYSLFRPLAESSIPLICTAGNHDRYTADPVCRAAMLDFYAKLANGRDQVFSESPFMIRMNNLRLAVLPESVPTAPWLSRGRLGPEAAAFLESEANAADPDPLICVGHFPLRYDSWRRGLAGGAAARALLDGGKIALSLAGHVHRQKIAIDARGRGEIIAGSLTRYGLAVRIEYDPATRDFTAFSLDFAGNR